MVRKFFIVLTFLLFAVFVSLFFFPDEWKIDQKLIPLFSGLAFIWFLYATILQRDAINQTKDQLSNMELQRFENFLFPMFNRIDDLKEKVKIGRIIITDNEEKRETVIGEDAFTWIRYDLYELHEKGQSFLKRAKRKQNGVLLRSADFTITEKNITYERTEVELPYDSKHAFKKWATTILKLIKQLDTLSISEETKKHYISFLKSNLDEEEFKVLYWCSATYKEKELQENRNIALKLKFFDEDIIEWFSNDEFRMKLKMINEQIPGK